MKFLALLLCAAPLALAAVISEKVVTYDGYRVVRIATGGRVLFEKQLKSLDAVQLDPDTLAISPGDFPKFENMKLEYEILDKDLGASIVAEGGFSPGSASKRSVSSLDELKPGTFPSLAWFDEYHTFAEHQQWLVDIQDGFRENSELIEIGKSYEGRPINGIHLWGKGGKDSKPAVLWHSTAHAREWITTMVVEYLIFGLITGYNSKNDQVRSILDKYDFFIIPVVNPDGFVYSKTTNRLWRKNRQPHPTHSCIGIDINRNWGHKWEVITPASWSSSNPCDEVFRGVAPDMAPEVLAVTKHAKSLAANKGIKLYIDWHSFSQKILLAYGYTCDKQVPGYERSMSLAKGVAAAIEGAHQKKFTPGSSCRNLYQFSGGSTDWMQDVVSAEISWCIELRPTGWAGFLLPASQIRASGEEQWEGMMYLLSNM
ncbi:hypothetical protein TWF481_009682 [Arthrobotrys musiformis]|uniref:Peptidase M14 domain-containing protein n=1 Tax=Arthrobotrys musiformis TaxID=47236 RepID=A0AAV9W5L7_9PEZI